jgi:hypothetical protein
MKKQVNQLHDRSMSSNNNQPSTQRIRFQSKVYSINLHREAEYLSNDKLKLRANRLAQMKLNLEKPKNVAADRDWDFETVSTVESSTCKEIALLEIILLRLEGILSWLPKELESLK